MAALNEIGKNQEVSPTNVSGFQLVKHEMRGGEMKIKNG